DDESSPPSHAYVPPPPPASPASAAPAPTSCGPSARCCAAQSLAAAESDRRDGRFGAQDLSRVKRLTGLRVAMVAPLYAPHIGGVEQHVSSLAGELSGLGHQIVVLTQEPDRGLLKDAYRPA